MYEKSSNIGSQLKKLLSSIERCADLVRQMESAVVTDNKQDKIANLSELLQKVSAIMMPRLSSGINLMLSKDPRTDNTAVRGDLTILANIMIEIMTNAAKALQPRGGRIDASISLEPNDVVQIVIKDDGPGIPLEVVRRIEDGTILGKSGHGLGLYLCRETVHHFGGQFRVEPLKQGTAVTMILPAVNLQSGDAS